jgi:hypothetical protein
LTCPTGISTKVWTVVPDCGKEAWGVCTDVATVETGAINTPEVGGVDWTEAAVVAAVVWGGVRGELGPGWWTTLGAEVWTVGWTGCWVGPETKGCPGLLDNYTFDCQVRWDGSHTMFILGYVPIKGWAYWGP